MFHFDPLSSESCSLPDPASCSEFAINSGTQSTDAITILLGQPQDFSTGSLKSLRRAVTIFQAFPMFSSFSSPGFSAQSKQKLSLATAGGWRGRFLVTELMSPLAITAQSDLIISVFIISILFLLPVHLKVCVLHAPHLLCSPPYTALACFEPEGPPAPAQAKLQPQSLLCNCTSYFCFPAKQSCGGPCNVRRAS